MASFSERVDLQRANDDRLEARKEPTSTGPAYMPNPGPQLHHARSNGILVAKKLSLPESILSATKRSEPELHIPKLFDLSDYQESSSYEGSVAFQETNEPLKTGSTKEVVESSQSGTQELPGSDNLSLDKQQCSEDDEDLIGQKLAILRARFRSLGRDKTKTSKQLASTESRESPLGIADAMVSPEQLESVESQSSREISELQKRLQQAELEREAFRRNFEDAQDQIFSMQPRRSDITEDEAAQEYGAFCANVERWIDAHLNDVLNLDQSIFAHSDVNIVSGSRLLALIEITPGAINAINVPDTLQYYLRSAIMNFTCREIFQQDLYTADTESWKLLHTIETSMRNLLPRRDRATIRAWRSETLTALIASSDYKNARRQHAKELSGRLCGGLEVLLPRASKTQLVQLKNSILQDLILPAIKLSERFHISAKVFSQPGRGIDKNAVPIEQEIDIYECRNFLDTGKLVKTLPHGTDCEYLLDICPGLSCSNLTVDSLSAPKMLKKARVLVAVKRLDKSYKLHGETALGHIFGSIEAQRKAKGKETENKESEKKRSIFGF